MESIAKDLEIDLTIHTDNTINRYSYRDLLEDVLSQPDKPDYILFMLREKVTHDMLVMADTAGVKTFTFNTDVPTGEISQTGQPRERLEHWIGHLSPDNQSAGKFLANELHERYQEVNDRKPDMIIGLAGSRDSSASMDRKVGLEQMLKAYPSTGHQLVFANWSQRNANEKVDVLIDRYPSLDLVWSASDGMAMGAIAATESEGRTPGKDIIIGGFDWEQAALDAIAEGSLALSMGGHFMGGGLALLLVRDYHAGHDFADQGDVSLQYSFIVADQGNLDSVRQVMEPGNWESTDFRQFSQHYNEVRRATPVTASGLINEFMGALSPDFR